MPYEFAREAALQLGLRSKEDWDEGIENGEIFQGPYLPSKPDEMYSDDWVSWEEFLGICRTYDESRQLIKDVLKFDSMNEYYLFVKGDPRRAAGLRLPAQPKVVFKESWVSDEHFLGKSPENTAKDGI
jgi:hypothetical protein